VWGQRQGLCIFFKELLRGATRQEGFPKCQGAS
jgi:hypothetical protein